MATTGQPTDDLKAALLDPSNHEEEDLEQGTATATTKPRKSLPPFLQPLEEKWKVQAFRWGTQIDFTVRLMMVASFLDDSIRTVLNMWGLTNMIFDRSILNRLTGVLPYDLVWTFAFISLLTGLVAQTGGSIGVLRLKETDTSTKALLVWTIAQPVLYGQLIASNAEFFAGSVSLLGSLLILRSHLVDSSGGARNQLIGRHLLPVVWLYYAGAFFAKAVGYEETSDMVAYILSVTKFVGCMVLLVLLIVGSFLVANGLRSRLVAFLLALANLGLICYRHPFLMYVGFENGEFYIKRAIFNNLPPVFETTKDVLSLDRWQIWGFHKYYFLVGLSTTGALLLLAQHGSGESAIRNKRAGTVV